MVAGYMRSESDIRDIGACAQTSCLASTWFHAPGRKKPALAGLTGQLPAKKQSANKKQRSVDDGPTVVWFRQDLRMHDNPALEVSSEL